MEPEFRVTDPTTAAREWLVANPDAPGAEYVRDALASADRYETLCAEMQEENPGTRVVICTYHETKGRSVRMILTAPRRDDEQEIARRLHSVHVAFNEVGQRGIVNSALTRLYRRAIATYGRDNQILALTEEIGELLMTINHFRRERVGRDTLLGEIADVRVMLGQLEVMSGGPDASAGDADGFMDKKLKRLSERLDERDRERAAEVKLEKE